MQVQILIATYNGAKYISEQLESIISQTYQSFEILIRDDGSTDATRQIIEAFVLRYPQKARLIASDTNLGPVGNFFTLMEASSAEYVMFCDQDDVWLPSKVQTMVSAMHQSENRGDGTKPVLVHSDLIVTDDQLVPIHSSFFAMQGLRPDHVWTERLLLQNHVTGCTVIVNRRCIDLALQTSGTVLMHDWWLALIATTLGTIGVVKTPTMYYRQHLSNVVGADQRTSFQKLMKLARANRHENIRTSVAANIVQAETFLRTFHSDLTPELNKKLARFVDLQSMSFLKKRFFLLRNGFVRHGLLPNISMMLFL